MDRNSKGINYPAALAWAILLLQTIILGLGAWSLNGLVDLRERTARIEASLNIIHTREITECQQSSRGVSIPTVQNATAVIK